MKDYTDILFDLDGTLTDSGEGIMNAAQHALQKLGIKESRDQLYTFVGPPLLDTFMEKYQLSEERAKLGVQYFQEYYSVKGKFENEVYSGIGDMLERLVKADKKLYVATSKPEQFAREILDYFHLTEYFTGIAGASMDETISRKDDILKMLFDRHGMKDMSCAVMVGDRKYDIAGAKKFGMDSIGVLFGFGSRSELEEARADYLAENPSEVADIVLN